jgi:zinc transport system substrate-binding protein
MKYPWILICSLASLFFLAAAAMPAEAQTVRTFVSIAPQKYFVQKIGGELVSVSALVPEGADPHTYEPRPKQMAELSRSAVYFAIGIDLEKVWLKRIAGTNPQQRIMHTEEGIEKIVMKNTLQGRAAAGHDHTAEFRDPHVWLSPALVKIQAGQILKALIVVDPQNQQRYKDGYTAFVKEIEALDAELKLLLTDVKNKQFMVFHPSWGYFARDYGLDQVPIEIEGKDPKPAQLRTLVSHARERGIKVVFVQPQFSAKSAAMVAREIEGQVIYVNPVAQNWADNLRDVARKFKSAAR